MRTGRLTVILLAVAIMLLAAVPQLRDALGIVRFNPIGGTVGTWLSKAEVERVAQRHPENAQIWLGFAESGASSYTRERSWNLTYPWDQSWLPEEAYQRAISLSPNSPAPYLRYALRFLAGAGSLGRKEEWHTGIEEEEPRTASEMSNLRQAENLLKQARHRDPENAACNYLLAYIHLARHEDKQAFGFLREAISKPHWSIGSQAAATAVLRLLDTTGSASPLLETHAMNIAFSGEMHVNARMRSVSVTLTELGERFRKSGKHDQAILCYEAAVHLGHIMRQDAYTTIDGLTAIAITAVAGGPFLSEQERQQIEKETLITADETHRTQQLLSFFKAIDAQMKHPESDEMEKFYRQQVKRQASRSPEQRQQEQRWQRESDERLKRMEQARVANFAAYMREHGRADLADFYQKEIQVANQWKKKAKAAADKEVGIAAFFYGWLRYSRLLWLEAGLLLALWVLVGLISVTNRYWRQREAAVVWISWERLALIGLLLAGIRLLAPWRKLHVYSPFYPYPIHIESALLGISAILVVWLGVVFVVTMLKRARQAPEQRLGKARAYLAGLRTLLPPTFAALLLLSVISLWPARQSLVPWRTEVRTKIQQGEVQYWGIGSATPQETSSLP